MAENFYTLLTNTGKAKIANASVLGQKVNFNKLVLGDSNGNYYEPQENQTALVHQVWEGQVGSVTVDETNPNWIVIETVIPTSVGGFTIREAGLLDDTGQLLVVAKYPETYKPIATEGTVKDLIVRMIFEVSNASVVTLKIDPTVVLATKKDLENLDAKHIKLNQAIIDTKASITTKDLTYYVNANTGLDTNDGLTSGTAFKTIQKAVDSVPVVLKHSVTINVADGTYVEDIMIKKYNTQENYIFLRGNESNRNAVKINGLIKVFESIVKITNVESISQKFVENYGGKVIIEFCQNIVFGEICVSNRFGGSCILYENIFSNKNIVFENNFGGGLVELNSCTGENNDYLFHCASGIIAIYNNALLPKSKLGNIMAGGIITGIAPQRHQLQLATGWSGDLYMYKTAENIVFITGLLAKKSDIFAGEVITTLPVGYRPFVNGCRIIASGGSLQEATHEIAVYPDGSVSINTVYPTDRGAEINGAFIAEN